MITLTMSGGETENVRQCLQVLLGTRAGTQALDREFGLDWSFLDLPSKAAKAACAAELAEKIGRYEPRVTVERVTFADADDGVLRPNVEVTSNV